MDEQNGQSGHEEQTEGAWQLFPPLPEELEAAGLSGRTLEAETAPADAYTEILESICGVTDDSQPVEQYDGTLGVTQAFVAAHQGPVGQLQWNSNLAAIFTNPGNVSGVRWCTGTLLSNGLFLTAGHCFDQNANGWQLPRVNGSNAVISPSEIATNMHVNFNFQDDPLGNPRQEQQFAVTALLEYRLGGLDFAIVQLAGNPQAAFGVGTVAAADAQQNDMVSIIGHPAGQRKRIEAGPVTALAGTQVRYNDIDTLGGNSGSAIFLSPAGTIVGVHTNGGCTAGGGFNFGVRVSSILAESPTLRALIQTFPDWQLLDNNPATVEIVAGGGQLYQRHNTGLIWRYTGTPLTGWQLLDNNPATVEIVASGSRLYQRHNSGLIWRYTGTPLTGWQLLDNNPATAEIVVSASGQLYQRHQDGKIWRYTGTPLTGWELLDNNPATAEVVAGGGRQLYQRHGNGNVWRYTGPPLTGWRQLDNNPATVGIAAGSGGQLYQRHQNGFVWRYTGS